jgi:curved DNA-binding protein CbpA
MVLANAAWAVLSNPERRQRYDASRKRVSTAVVPYTEPVVNEEVRKKAEQYPHGWADYEKWLDSNEDVWLRSFDQTCPACGREQSKQYRPPGDLFRNDTFSIVALRKCKRCGAVFMPPAPAWAIGVTAVLGFGLLALASLFPIFWLLGTIKSPENPNPIGLIVACLLFAGMPGIGGVALLRLAYLAVEQRRGAAAVRR